MMTRLAVLLLCACSSRADRAYAETQGNPIRKVVTLLQDMQKEIAAEGEKEKAAFDKFMCYCDGNTDGMSKAAKDASQQIIALNSKLEAETAESAQVNQELMAHKADREAARQDLEQATTVRNKEHEAYVAETGESKGTIDQLTGAIDALEKGMGAKALVQMSGSVTAAVAERARSFSGFSEDEKDEVAAFLQSKQNPFGDYSSRSGEIVGLLKAMKDEFNKDLNGAVQAEETAQAGFEELKAAKEAEIAAAGSAIESKTKRSGNLAVSIVTTKDAIEDTTKDMDETNAFLANLAAQCAAKKSEWDERQKMRGQELSAIGEAIKVLNDDDALDIFKSTLSLSQGPQVGFLQKRALEAVTREVRSKLLSLKDATKESQLGLIAYALKAKKVDFTKVVAMIDNMVAQLSKDQANDDAQKAFCDKDLARSEASKKDTEDAIASSEATIADATDESAQTAAAIVALQDEVKALDKAVADASQQRKEEHGLYTQEQTELNAASQLIEKAKNKLFKFYRSNLYKEEPQRELTDEEKILASSGRSDMIATEAPQMIAGTTQTVYAQVRAHRASPTEAAPETWDGGYKSKDGKSNGVIALMDMLHKELQDNIAAGEHEESTAQKEYERLMASSTERRAQCVKSITSKEGAKADLDVKVEETKELKTSQEAELMNLQGYISQLHSSCDFLVQNYDLRKAARANESESLKNAKSVLAGADFK